MYIVVYQSQLISHILDNKKMDLLFELITTLGYTHIISNTCSNSCAAVYLCTAFTCHTCTESILNKPLIQCGHTILHSLKGKLYGCTWLVFQRAKLLIFSAQPVTGMLELSCIQLHKVHIIFQYITLFIHILATFDYNKCKDLNFVPIRCHKQDHISF